MDKCPRKKYGDAVSSGAATKPVQERLQDEVRQATRASRDPRAARTRAAILAAVDELTAQGVAAPSVSEIVLQAGISRSSFYTQFASVEQLTMAVFADALQQTTLLEAAARTSGEMSDYEATRQAIARLVEHVAEHRGLYRLGLPATGGAYLHVVATVARQFEGTACLAAAPDNGVDVRAATTYLAGGTLALLHVWVTGELVATNEQITAQLTAMLPAWLTAPVAAPQASTQK
jgi:AcrR family transcriptional regulator